MYTELFIYICISYTDITVAVGVNSPELGRSVVLNLFLINVQMNEWR